jgi:hypothetical protein
VCSPEGRLASITLPRGRCPWSRVAICGLIFNLVTIILPVNTHSRLADRQRCEQQRPRYSVTFAIDPTTGVEPSEFRYLPTSLGSVLAHPSRVSPYGGGNNTILAYSIGGNGNLTPPGSPLRQGSGCSISRPWLLTAECSYVGNIFGSAAGTSRFRIDQTTGALTSIAGSLLFEGAICLGDLK